METILSFFSDLILFTAGLFVCTVWIIIIILASVEIYDLVTGKDSKLFPEGEDPNA